MQLIGILVAVFSIVAAVVGWESGHNVLYLLAAFSALAAYTTFRSSGISTFLQILIRFFAVEIILLGGCVCANALGYWPKALADYRIPSTVAITVALFAILIYAASFIPVARRSLAIADRYFRTEDRLRIPLGFGLAIKLRERRVAAGALMFIVVLNQLEVFFAVMISFVSRGIFNALQAYNAPEFWHQFLVQYPKYLVPYLVALFIEFLAANTLSVRWRTYLTQDYTRRWLDKHNHYGMMLAGVGTDNPDQRIQEDIPRFIDGGQFGGLGVYNFSINLISQLSSLVSYSIILWGLSASLVFPGTSFQIPGFLLWCALIYAIIGTGAASIIGRPLATLAFARQHYEANFRFGLARLREYSEQIALLFGELTEKSILAERFLSVVRNFYSVMFVKSFLHVFTNFFNSISGIMPLVIMAPFYFTKKIVLGDLTLGLDAFGNVNSSLTFFVTYYSALADFRSVLDRLTTFDASLEATSSTVTFTPPQEAGTKDFVLSNVSVRLPNGKPLFQPFDLRLAANENVLVSGPSGSGKSTLFRAMSGAWPYGEGTLRKPEGAAVMVLPQKPYLPIGTLMAAVSYPKPHGTYPLDVVVAALQDVKLAPLVEMLEIDDNWTQRLSGGEQQRLAIARAILAKPDWLLLDEATSAMDAELEGTIYDVLAKRLPDTTIISIAHRDTLSDHHSRVIQMKAQPDGGYLPAIIEKAAAE